MTTSELVGAVCISGIAGAFCGFCFWLLLSTFREAKDE